MTLEHKCISTKLLNNLGNFAEFVEFQIINGYVLSTMKNFVTVLHFLTVDKKITFTINTTTNSYLWVT